MKKAFEFAKGLGKIFVVWTSIYTVLLMAFKVAYVISEKFDGLIDKLAGKFRKEEIEE